MHDDIAGMTDRPVREKVLAWISKAAFVAIFVMPVLYAAFYVTDFASGAGRVGFLLPAIVLADAQNRQTLSLAMAGCFLAAFASCILGTALGLSAAHCGGPVFKIFRTLAFLPGRIPAWVFPAIFAVGRSALGLNAIPDSISLYVWVGWVAWWGATRLGDILADAARSVSLAEWDAVRTLSGDSIAAFKMTMLPRVAANYRKEIKRIAGVCLFDPAPVFFLGLSNWPIAHVARSLGSGQLRGAVDASSWLVWSFAIWCLVAFAFRIACGKRGPVVLAASEDPSRTRAADSPTALSRTWLILACWPFILAALLTIAVCARLWTNAGLKNAGDFAESHWAWNDSFAFGASVSLAAAVSIAILARFADTWRAVRFLNSVCSFWPLEASIGSVAILEIVSKGPLSGPGGAVIGGMIDEIWLAVFVFFAFSWVGRRSMRRFPVERGMADSPDRIAKTAAEAARTMGIPKRQSDELAKVVRRKSQVGIPVASVLLSSWWLWNSPSWALVPLWRISSVPAGGHLLVSQFREKYDAAAGLTWLVIVLGVAAILALVSWLAQPKIRRPESVS